MLDAASRDILVNLRGPKELPEVRSPVQIVRDYYLPRA